MTEVSIALNPHFPAIFRAMSLHFPFAQMIVQGEKPTEYRTRPTKYRGLVLIHANGSKDSDDLIYEYGISPDQVVRRAIIGVVEIIDCLKETEDYTYKLENPIAFDQPIPIARQQSIFWGGNTPEQIQAFNLA